MQSKTTQIVITIFILLVIVGRLLWPSSPLFDNTTLILIGFGLVIWFGQRLFKSMTLPGGLGFEFQEDTKIKPEEKVKVKEQAINDKEQQPSIAWDKVATLFWLGNDLMWIEDMTYRYAQPERVLQGIDHALRYIEQLGFASNAFPVQELGLAKITLQSIGNLTREDYRQVLHMHYSGIRQHIETVKWYIHSLANIEQPGFEKLRAL